MKTKILFFYVLLSLNMVWGQQIVDGFDYPIGNKGYDINGNKVPISEGISSFGGEINQLYPLLCSPSNVRVGNAESGWYNIQDVGSYLGVYGGITYNGYHPGEDWNKVGGDLNEKVYSIAHGKIIKILNLNSLGKALIIEHLLSNYSKVYSVFVHIGNIQVTENQIVSRGQYICDIVDVTAFSYEHLHFELWNGSIVPTSSNLWSNTNSGYYTSINDMTNKGIIDPSDYIDNNRDLNKPINGGLDIYAGTPISAGYNNVKLWCYPSNMQATIGAVNGISDFKINGNPKSITASNLSYSNGKLQFNVSFNNVVTNMNAGPMDFEFTVNYNNNSEQSVSQKFFGTKQLYYLQANNFSDLIDSDSINGYKEIEIGVKNGLFKGSYQNGVWYFNPPNPVTNQVNEYLTKGQACKIIVSALFRLNMIQGINTSGTVPTILANQTDQEMFKYAMTLYNSSSGNLPNIGTFNLEENIKVEEFSSMIFTALDVPTVSNLSNKISNLTYNASLPAYDLRMRYVGKIGVPILDDTNSVCTTRPLASFLPFTTSTSGTNVVDGTEYMQRSTMAIFLTNAFLWKASEINGDADPINNTTVYRLNQSNINSYYSTISDIKVIGDIPESSNTPSGNPPALNTSLQSSYVITDNQTLSLSHPSNYDSANNSSPLYFYWTANGGQSFINLTSNYRSVKFTPNIVSTPTTYKLYSLVGNANGMIREYWINVTVNPSAGGSGNPTGIPTTQANTLQLYGSTANSISASWTRGNGQNCIVVCYPVSANAQDTPSSGVLYSGNSNFLSAPFVFAGSDTKVVYTGTGNTCTITGLDTNTQYRISVLEYNGNTNGNIYYNYNNIPTATLSTLLPVNQQVIANFTVSQTNLLPSTNYQINNTTIGADTYSWSCIPTATFSNHNSYNTSINFPASGSYTIRLDASNSQSGVSSYALNTVYVNSPSDLYPDFQPTITSVSTTNIVTNSNVSLNFGISNNGTGYVSNGQMFISIYLSKDQSLDVNDFLFSGANYLQIVDTFSANSIFALNPLTLFIGDQSIYVNNGPGQYYLIIKVDSQGSIQETNESNNIALLPITIQAAYPDLYVQNITMPSSVASSQIINITTTLNNSGYTHGEIFSLNYFLSYDNILSSDDVFLTFSYPNDVYPNTPLNVNKSITLPSTLTNGIYYLIVGDNNLCQSDYNKNNNSFAKQFTVQNPVSQPTIQASNIEVTNITSISMTVSWTNGNGANRIVVMRENQPLEYTGQLFNSELQMPKDGTSYSTNSDFTQAGTIVFSNTTNYPKVVYFGNNNSVNISGLNPNKNYYINVYEANGTGTTIDYLQANPLKYIVSRTKNTNNYSTWTTVVDSYFNGIKNIQFVSNNEIFAQSSTTDVIHSLDNGDSWMYKSSNLSNLLESKYIGNNKVVAITDNNILLSTNAGQSFSVVNVNSNPLYSSYSDIQFPSQNIGYVSYGQDGIFGKIYKSTNGGTTWQVIYTTTDPINKMFFISDNTGYAASRTKFYKTTDGGNTWAVISTQGIFCGLPITKIQFLNQNEGYVLSYCGKMFKTIDGGSNWVSLNITGQNNWNDFYFVNNQKGYFVQSGNTSGSNTFGITNDGGATWTLQQLPSTVPSNLNNLAIKNLNEVWLGWSSLIKTTTGGQNNAIALNSLSQNTFCTGSAINLSYNITGNYESNESFVVEISDTSGSFNNDLILATITNIGQGNISVVLPHTLTNGNYNFRIKNNDGSLISNVLDIVTINQASTPAVFIDGSNTICQGNPLTFTATGSHLGNNPIFQWYVNNIAVGTNSATFTSNTLNTSDIVSLKVTSNDSCIVQHEVFSNVIVVNVISQPELPTISQFDDILVSSSPEGNQWYLNGNPIDGATDQFIQIAQAGTYAVTVNVNPCNFVTSENFVVSQLLLNEFSNNIEVQIHPNPTNDILNIELLENLTIENIRIYNVLGQKLENFITNDNFTKVDISKLPSATYFVEIHTNKGTQTYKVLKN